MSNITLTIPNDDHIALRAFGKALEEMALAHGAEPLEVQTYCNVTFNDENEQALREKLKSVIGEPQIDTTTQQVEALADRVDAMLEVAEQPFQGEQVVPTTDSTGTPWDERIHSASKALNSDGTWRLRRKPKDMDEVEWATFVDGIKACYEIDNSPVQQVEQPFTCEQQPMNLDHVSIEPPVTPPSDDFQTDTSVVTEQTVAGIPPLPVPPPVVVAPPVPVQAALSEGIARYGDAMSELAKNDGNVQWDFPRLMTFLTERHGKIDVATVNTLLAQDGMSSVQELNAHPDKIGPFVARVKAHLGE